MENHRLRRIVRQTLRGTAVVVTILLAIQWTFKSSSNSKASNYINSRLGANGASSTPEPHGTVWETIRNDTRVSKFVKVLGEFKSIVAGLDAPKAKFTVYVPTDEAFEKETFAWDLPSFYWLYLIGYHMGAGALSQKDFSHMTTAPSFVFADVFETYRQRISIQRIDEGDSFMLNHVARPAAPEMPAVNGYVHLIDRVLMMPESTSDLLRDDPKLSKLRKALIDTDVAVTVNDTSTHVGQTIFAPTNKAFDKLGSKANQFLFSPYGKEYLRALLQYHIVANQTMFSNLLLPHNGAAQIPLENGSKIHLPTLLPSHNLSVTVEMNGPRVSPKINNAVSIESHDIVVMDGVVHKIDTVLLPPLLSNGEESTSEQSWMSTMAQWLLGPSGVPVGELKKRLERLVVEP
ncbi:hypothetical protein H112_05095 [Trichophyton rubrum D6]|uniref:FAS1 domain-containing protein n=2 Tax=Trichophyton TaxID=5550 RepID=A0A022VZS3_TRIRU|nr:hypothetical protein H100_05118 [Trichophyton rubrum MR850]EZF40974.1 hypothetical protein H102_05104 [Trichophyton rubrum CBS 100081]EZF51600.1 hypothetical protein H103_05105 [Trichophyton rubrum CBS 288.86]EZF62225.1 hypothetical protein H104_05099 [Trichophyton rubrum CBS 289.86]EZF72845.1 hypothetical protein H105_05125 [Trichophyton soudanense CBS 452.61]EZF83560.1 hypothetical protein H110_05104 [Trichophyton rubrum MR1448]EZG15811.1 hypothetical protein H107_05236 [Trichophyton rub